MCVMSMIYDHYRPMIPQQPYWEQDGTLGLLKTIQDFEKAKKAAETVDELTGQKDCVDPKKQELDATVATLKKAIEEAPTIVIEKSVTLEAGTYRLLGGKLYRMVE